VLKNKRRTFKKSPLFLTGEKLDFGLLFLRIGLGIVFIFHGYPKLIGGPERWEQVGSTMSNLGIDSYHIYFGFLAACSEFFGGIFLIFGLYMLPVVLLLIVTMIVALVTQIARDTGYSGIAHPLSLGIVFLSMLYTGPGKYSLDHYLMGRSRR
jgi:putative oxidoreductase